MSVSSVLTQPVWERSNGDVEQRGRQSARFWLHTPLLFLATWPYSRRRSANPCSQSLRTSRGNPGGLPRLGAFPELQAGDGHLGRFLASHASAVGSTGGLACRAAAGVRCAPSL